MSVICVKVKNIRPKYNNLKEWMEDSNNVYIGRKGIVFIKNSKGKPERFPKTDSIWANPFKISKECNRYEVVKKYRIYIIKKIKDEKLENELLKLKDKTLGCWCNPELCHGDILLELLKLY